MNLTDADREALRVACGFMRNRNVEAVAESIRDAAVAAAVQATTERVLAVHPNEDGYCGSCIDAYESPHEWPCPTVAALAGSTDPTPDTRTEAEDDRPSVKQCGWCARLGHTTDECPTPGDALDSTHSGKAVES